MMGFSIRFSRKDRAPEGVFCRTWLRRWLCAGIFQLLLLTSAAAQSVGINNLQVENTDTAVYLNVDLDLNLGARLGEAVERGIALYFIAEAELTRPRWWWFDENVVSRQERWRLSYNTLTRQYRLANGPLALPFSQLDEALGMMTHLRHWQIALAEQLPAGTRYVGRFRFRLDLSQLPQPFQVNALNSRDWNLATEWRSFEYEPGAADAPEAPR